MKTPLISYVVITIISFSVFSCGKFDTPADTPDCISDSIQDFAKEAACDDVSIEEYKFQGELVYCYNSGSCGADMDSKVCDAECHVLGYLGGIVGNTSINGESFSTAEYIRTIWKAQ